MNRHENMCMYIPWRFIIFVLWEFFLVEIKLVSRWYKYKEVCRRIYAKESSTVSRWRRRVSSIKTRYKLAVKSDSPLILYSANFRYKIANFFARRWDMGQERGERRERKMVASGQQKFYECKTFGSVNTFLPIEMQWKEIRKI